MFVLRLQKCMSIVMQKSLPTLNSPQLKSASDFSLSFLFIPLFGGGEVTLELSLSPGEVTLKLHVHLLLTVLVAQYH